MSVVPVTALVWLQSGAAPGPRAAAWATATRTTLQTGRNSTMASTLCRRNFARPCDNGQCDRHGNFMTADGALDGAGIFAAIEQHQNPIDCAAAKFAVLAFPSHHGIGMALKEGPVAALLFAMSTNRVLLFENNRRTPRNRHRSLGAPFRFTSCPRQHHSCDFLPMSRCGVTDEELDGAIDLGHAWDRSNARRASHLREIAANTSHHRVVVLGRVGGGGASGCWDGSCWGGVLRLGPTGRLLPAGSGIAAEGFIVHTRTLMTAAKLYILRMNEQTLRAVTSAIEGSIPPGFDAANTVGLPIRAGDKCKRESSCPSFENYMALATDASRCTGGALRHVIITSETEEMVSALKSRVFNGSGAALRVVTNGQDVMQGHGDPKRYGSSATEVMISTLSSLGLQLRAAHLIINCCSNFHKLMGDFTRFAAGRCGSGETDPAPQVQCATAVRCNIRAAAASPSRGANGCPEFEPYDD